MTEFYYKEILESDVDPQKVREAREVLKFCSKFLNLPYIKIQWCKKVDKKDFGEPFDSVFGELRKELGALAGYRKFKKEFYGMTKCITDKDKILIRTDLSLEVIKETIAHECGHRYDFENYGLFNNEEMERRADEMARELMKKYKNLKERRN